jgi:hypothetical protein
MQQMLVTEKKYADLKEKYERAAEDASKYELVVAFEKCLHERAKNGETYWNNMRNNKINVVGHVLALHLHHSSPWNDIDGAFDVMISLYQQRWNQDEENRLFGHDAVQSVDAATVLFAQDFLKYKNRQGPFSKDYIWSSDNSDASKWSLFENVNGGRRLGRFGKQLTGLGMSQSLCEGSFSIVQAVNDGTYTLNYSLHHYLLFMYCC